MESVADEEHHGVVGADDQDKKNQCRNHHPSGTRGDGGKCTFMLSVFVTNKNEQIGGAPHSPSVPDEQPADIEAQIDAPAYEEAVWQHCRAAVNVAISGP